MEIRKLTEEKKAQRISFLIKGASPSFANALRRTIVHEVPTMAIDEVEFKQNSSILYDEIIAHRLGLLPIKTDLSSYVQRSKCGCDGVGCAKCTLKFTLKAKGPCTVLAKDLKSQDPKVVPVYPEMPIVKLLKGQELELEATAVLGSGKDHMKWAPAHVWYKYRPVVDITKNPDNAEEIAKRCPVDVFDCKAGKLSINKDNYLACTLCGECADLSGGLIKLNETDEDFVFFVESFGQLSCAEIVQAAVDVFGEQLDGLMKTVSE